MPVTQIHVTPSTVTQGQVLILRGLPGSGKTSFIAQHLPEVPATNIFSADSFFLDAWGRYCFDVTKLKEAHAQCLRKYTAALLFGGDFLVVDNTNTRGVEVAPYYALGEAMGFQVTLITFPWGDDPEVYARRNVHGVLEGTIGAMQTTLRNEKLPPWWRHMRSEEWVNERKTP